jgi:nicotinic acid mononucleotide adenylyltransferase
MESSITRDRAQAAQLKSNVFDRRNLLHRYLTQPVGVACSSALQTTVTGNSSESTKTAKSQAADQRESQAHIVVNRPDGREVHELSMVIKNVGLSRSTNPGDVGDEGQSTPAPVQEQDPDRRLTRFLEDVVVAHGILSCIECAVLGADGSFSHSSDSTKSDASSADHDVVVDYRVQRAPELVPTPECYQTRTIYHATNELSQASPIVVNEATNRIFSCQNSVVALVPEYHPSFMTACDRDSVSKDEPSQGSCRVSFSVLTRFALPPSSVVFPGSFNPIHDGHVQLAKAAVDAVPQVRNVVWFELALTNADKPSLSVEEVRRRVQFFAEYFTQNNDDENGFQWGILLTNAPLFRQKVELLQPLIVPSGASSHGRTDAVSDELNLDMIIGVDTLVRLSDPKYYDGSHKKMVEAIRSMPVRFVVGGRVAQPTSGSANTTAPKDIRHGEPPSAQFSSDTSFITGHDQVAQLPEDLQSKFVLLSEDSFRVDISSTEIRRNCRKKYHG